MPQPLVYQAEETVAANSTVENAIQNIRLVQPPRDGVLTFFCQGSATGLKMTLLVDSDEVVLDSNIGFGNRYPEQDKDRIISGVYVRGGSRITLRFVNPTAGALTAFYRLNFKPVR